MLFITIQDLKNVALSFLHKKQYRSILYKILDFKGRVGIIINTV